MTKPLLYLLIATFLWGIHGPAGRFLAESGVDMNFVFSARLWMGTSVFFLYLLLTGNLKILNWKENIKKVLSIALFGLVLNTLIFHRTLNYLPGTFVMVLENLAPIFVFTATLIFYKLKPLKVEIFALLVSITGVIMIVLGKGSFPELADGYYFGIFLGILTAMTFGGYTFLSADLMRDYKHSPVCIIRFLFKIFLIAAITCSPFLFTAKSYPSSSSEWFWLIQMGIMQSGVAYIFWNFALSHIKANTAAILFMLTILFTTINEVVFLNLKLNSHLVIGALCICLSGCFISISLRKR